MKKLAEGMICATFKPLIKEIPKKGPGMKVGTRIYTASVLAGLLLLPGCFGNSSKDESGVKVINVLDKQFYDDAHIPGSINISVMQVEEKAKAWPKTTKIVVYCSNYTCSASGMIARKLKTLGFEDVFAYEAGMAGWKQAGLPVDGPAKEKYLDAPNEKFSDRKSPEVKDITTEDLKSLLDTK
jgi:rhodanese-related sulfurtransferase